MKISQSILENLNEDSDYEQKQYLFSLIHKLNHNAKKENYMNRTVNEMLAILHDMRENKDRYINKNSKNNKNNKQEQPDKLNKDFAIPEDNPELFDNAIEESALLENNSLDLWKSQMNQKNEEELKTYLDKLYKQLYSYNDSSKDIKSNKFEFLLQKINYIENKLGIDSKKGRILH